MKTENSISTSLESIVSFCKRRGFVYQSCEIYGGMNGFYDFGHLGVLLKNNIRKAWLESLENDLGQIIQLEGSVISSENVFKASGHIDNFHDPMVDCKECKHRFRADEFDLSLGCPNCKKHSWTEIRNFNMMFKTEIGALESSSSTSYLRPETAQSIFVNFKNVYSTSRVKIPFGIAQIGKSFRNEITPKQFLFRMREFEQMEIEWFCHQEDASSHFDFWSNHRMTFYKNIGLNLEKIRFRNHKSDELAHYSSKCIDVEYNFPFGWKELEGIAYRGNFDLSQHSKFSGKDLSVFDEFKKESYVPHVVESSVGADRLFLTILFDAYYEDLIDGETRVVLKLHSSLAPIKIAFLSLTKKQDDNTKNLFDKFKKYEKNIIFDNSGSIGKRYRRYDEIGTPVCITYDFDSEVDHCVTVRDRDTTEQERISIEKLFEYLQNLKIFI